MDPLQPTSPARRIILAAFAGLAACGLPAAGQPEPDPSFTAEESVAFIESLAPENAALVYYQLFLQENKPLSEGYVHFNADSEDDETFAITREEAEQAFADGQEYLDNFGWAANLPECDFGIQYQQGWNAILPHLGKLRQAARVLAADARRHLAAGDADKAAERLDTIYNMARQLRRDRILISSLVSAAMCAHAHEGVKEILASGALSEAGRDRLVATLERFGTDDPFAIRECVKMEGAISAGWVVRTFPEGGAGSKLAEWNIIDAKDRALVRRYDAMDGNTLRREAERMTEYHRRALEVWDDADAVAKLEALAVVVEAGGFGELAKGFGAAFSKAKEQSLRAQGQLQETIDALLAYRPHEEPAEDGAETATTPGR